MSEDGFIGRAIDETMERDTVNGNRRRRTPETVYNNHERKCIP